MRLARNNRIHWLISTRVKTVLEVRLAAAGLSEGLREVLRAAGLRGNGSVTKRSFFTFIFHAESVPRGGGPRGGGPRPLPPGPRGGGPRLWKSTSNHEVRRSTRRFSTKIPGFFSYTGPCGGAPLGGGPRGGGPLGGGPRGGGPRGGPPMVFYVACSRPLRRGLRPAAVLYDAPAGRARRSTRAAT